MSETDNHISLAQSIVRTLLYYDLFNYPLMMDEVYLNLQTDHVTREEVGSELEKLRDTNVLFQTGELYSVRQDKELIDRRIRGNKFAQSYRKIAERRGKLIYSFPFVRAVMISGSLSKNYADENTDIDFFIITSPSRLWIARMMLVTFKRIFLFNSHKFFCVNYFIDSDHLEIAEKNIFTATEVSTLIPLQGYELYKRFYAANNWISGFLPHSKHHSVPAQNDDWSHWLKNFLERILSSHLGSWLDGLFMRMTRSRWKRLYAANLERDDFEIAFKSSGHVSKNHPSNYQRSVLERYRNKLNDFKTES